LLSDTVRETDVIGRYGGEEFLCVLPNTDVEGAAAVAEKLRRVVEARVFTEGFFNIELTASFGVSSTGPDVTTEGALWSSCRPRALPRQAGRSQPRLRRRRQPQRRAGIARAAG
jgi:diguanylate cyclase (GGDEF)-like protein